MTQKSGGLTCVIGCWLIGALAGLLTFGLLVALGGFGYNAAVFLGGIVFVIAGAFVSWAFCSKLPALGEVEAPVATGVSAPAPKATAPTVPASTSPATTTSDAAPTKAAAAKPKATPAPAEAEAEGEDIDGKPELLKAARDGGPDDLKQIKGVGAALEDMLHGMGIYHFDQVANWSDEEVAWVDRNMPKFKGRVSRDDWRAQAQILASGGDTEFSKKVEKGDVY